jgi:predicted Zn-dependent protease
MRGSLCAAREHRRVSRLRIVPINRIDSELLDRLGVCLEERFLLESVIEQPVRIPETALNRERDQLFFPTLIARVQSAYSGGENLVLAITTYDLFKTTQRFVYAGTSDDGRIAAVSLKRLMTERDPSADTNLLFQRLLKQATHAIGRSYGLSPCHKDCCVMALAGTVYEIDSAHSILCDTCERKNRIRHSERGH